MIEAVVTCVNYADYLRETLPLLRSRVDRVLVVTTPTDEQTIDVCEQCDVQYLPTFAFHRDGAKFAKGLAINEGLRKLQRTGWLLHVDADTAILDSFNVDNLAPQCLWTAPRRRVVGKRQWREVLKTPSVRGSLKEMRNIRRHGHLVPSGYFQLWHFPTRGRFYAEDSSTAARSDMTFSKLWSGANRRLIPGLHVYHLETADNHNRANWQGRTTAEFS
jgi:hypothetical protein